MKVKFYTNPYKISLQRKGSRKGIKGHTASPILIPKEQLQDIELLKRIGEEDKETWEYYDDINLTSIVAHALPRLYPSFYFHARNKEAQISNLNSHLLIKIQTCRIILNFFLNEG